MTAKRFFFKSFQQRRWSCESKVISVRLCHRQMRHLKQASVFPELPSCREVFGPLTMMLYVEFKDLWNLISLGDHCLLMSVHALLIYCYEAAINLKTSLCFCGGSQVSSVGDALYVSDCFNSYHVIMPKVSKSLFYNLFKLYNARPRMAKANVVHYAFIEKAGWADRKTGILISHFCLNKWNYGGEMMLAFHRAFVFSSDSA